MSVITTLASKEHVAILVLSGDQAIAVISRLWSWYSWIFLSESIRIYILIVPLCSSHSVNLSNAEASNLPSGLQDKKLMALRDSVGISAFSNMIGSVAVESILTFWRLNHSSSMPDEMARYYFWRAIDLIGCWFYSNRWYLTFTLIFLVPLIWYFIFILYRYKIYNTNYHLVANLILRFLLAFSPPNPIPPLNWMCVL